MKKIYCYLLLGLFFLLSSCKSKKLPILNDGYLGMTLEEYNEKFNTPLSYGTYKFTMENGNLDGKLEPRFKHGHLITLNISIQTVWDFRFEGSSLDRLKNAYIEKYGEPVKREITEENSTFNRLAWIKGDFYLTFDYSSKKSDYAGIGEASAEIKYDSSYEFQNQFNENSEEKTKSKL